MTPHGDEVMEHRPVGNRGALPRRRFVLSVAAAAGLSVFGATPAAARPATAEPASPGPGARPSPMGPAAPAAPQTPAFALPAPTGEFRIGTVALHLVDRSRPDPWVTPPRARELMVQLWYPTHRPDDRPLAPWLTPAEAGPVGRDLVETVGGAPREVPGLADVRTHGRVGAPVAARPGGWPVVLFSPGLGAERNSSAALVEDLASRGYVVVALDHTHDAMAVEFPGGRLEPNTIMDLLRDIRDPAELAAFARRMVTVRVDDARFVLDRLAVLDAGGNPDAEGRRLPTGLCGGLRLTGVGVFGHSLGGATAAQLMHDDPRVTAGINLDGTPYGADSAAGLDRPFLLFAAADHTRADDPAWGVFADNLRGWHHEIRLAGSRHLSFHDSVLLGPELARIAEVPAERVVEAYGTIDGRRAAAVARAYVGAFFDLHLRRIDRHLFDRSSSRYPEVTFVS
ncbi:hydrolase [Longispora sp. K20-0274]|uniref:alpha/beta hydrolase family protein n=1 Tax=Longispora sp. K20-0274 TaxID=3088255 RepID=UPI00399BE812